jgi:hypothetical protein
LETVSHIFQDCYFARLIWDKVSTWIEASAMNPANWVQTADLSQWFIDVGASADNNRSVGTRSMVMLTA